MSNWLKLEGDVCAVTGALGGMGVEICREFARNGANVVLLDLDEEKVKAAAADLAAEFGIHAEGYKMNATDETEVQAAVDATIANFGCASRWAAPINRPTWFSLVIVCFAFAQVNCIFVRMALTVGLHCAMQFILN